MAKRPVLGILTIYLNDRKAVEERAVYEKMTVEGRRLGVTVYVFTPEDVEERHGRVHALVFHPYKKVWGRRWMKPPHIVYDRARYRRNKRFARLQAFRKQHADLLFLNKPLRNKWILYRTLNALPAFRSHLPATRLYRSPQDIRDMLERYETVYFKPINGTGGRGILRIDRLNGGLLLLQGRNQSRRIVTPRRIRRSHLPAVIRTWDLGGDRYIVQQGLDVKLPNGRVHDYRLLVQKNGKGNWEVTGCAGRVGPRRSVTSNLHGGGTAVSMNELLRQWVGDESRTRQIRDAAESLGVAVAETLERTYGKQCELALDLAIDRQGHIWLLEVNPKPAREVFVKTGERDIYHRAIVRPLEYALWVYRQKQAAQS